MNAHFPLAQLARDAEMLDSLCGDDERLYADMVEGETDLFKLVARVHEQIARDQEMLTGIAARKAAIKEREDRIKARVDGGKSFIGKCLRVARLKKVELPEVTYSVRDGKPGLSIVNDDAVPDQFCTLVRKPMKAEINAAFADDADLPNWLTRTPAHDVVTARKG